MHGVDGAPLGPDRSNPQAAKLRHIDETCLMLMLGTLDLPLLDAVTFRGLAAMRSSGLHSAEDYRILERVNGAGFFPFRRFLVQPTRKLTKLRFHDCGIGTVLALFSFWYDRFAQIRHIGLSVHGVGVECTAWGVSAHISQTSIAPPNC